MIPTYFRVTLDLFLVTVGGVLEIGRERGVVMCRFVCPTLNLEERS